MKLLTPRNLWNHETMDTTKPMKPWNYWHHETYETMKPLTPRNLRNHETIDTTKPMKPWNHRHHETYETMKLLTPRNLWNNETIDTMRPLKPWLHDTIIIWHRHWHILISINSCTVTPSCNQPYNLVRNYFHLRFCYLYKSDISFHCEERFRIYLFQF